MEMMIALVAPNVAAGMKKKLVSSLRLAITLPRMIFGASVSKMGTITNNLVM